MLQFHLLVVEEVEVQVDQALLPQAVVEVVVVMAESQVTVSTAAPSTVADDVSMMPVPAGSTVTMAWPA